MHWDKLSKNHFGNTYFYR